MLFNSRVIWSKKGDMVVRFYKFQNVIMKNDFFKQKRQCTFNLINKDSFTKLLEISSSLIFTTILAICGKHFYQYLSSKMALDAQYALLPYLLVSYWMLSITVTKYLQKWDFFPFQKNLWNLFLIAVSFFYSVTIPLVLQR